MGLEWNSLDVASFIAKKCNEYGYFWNNTKIQKLLYCCYGCFLAAYDGDRLCDEYPRAWQYGPVFPRVFNYIHKKKPFPTEHSLEGMDDDRKTFLSDVIRVFGKYNAVPLSEWTHKAGSPWSKAVYELDGGMNSFIPDDIIKDYFSKNVVEKIANGSTH